MHGLRILLWGIWRIAAFLALLVALPLVALTAMVLGPAALANITNEPLLATLTTVWPAAGAAGIVGLFLGRQRNTLSPRTIRVYQALLAAGIAAALAAVFVLAVAFPTGAAAISIAAFAVLIAEAVYRIVTLERRAAAQSTPGQRAAAALLVMATISALGALAGHLVL